MPDPVTKTIQFSTPIFEELRSILKIMTIWTKNATREALKEKVTKMLHKAKEHKVDEMTEPASPLSSLEGTLSSTNDCKI